jgi:hypothetical protein
MALYEKLPTLHSNMPVLSLKLTLENGMDNRHIEADRMLKRLLGLPRGYPLHWSKSNAAAFALMVDHGCYPSEREGSDTVDVWIESDGNTECGASVLISNQPSKEVAVRYAIVNAVIFKLTKAL